MFPTTDWGLFERVRGADAQALPLLHEAAMLAPSHAWVHDCLGVALVLSGQIEARIAGLRLAAQLAPWDAEIREHLDLALAEQGK